MPQSHVSSRPLLSSWRLAAAGAAVLAIVALTACGKGKEPTTAGGAPGGMAPPPPEVGVVVVTPTEVGLITELPGRLEASRVSEVRARAAGILQERLFREGSDVKAGQPLFRIDSAPYAAASRSARASLSRAEANASQAKALADRYKPLVGANAVSKQEYANAVAAQKAAEADVGVARASVTTANINLGYATVTAPISGRIGRALVTEGALVGQGDATQLAVIQQINPLYVNFTQSANEVLKLRRAVQNGQFKSVSGADSAGVRVVLEDGSEYPLPGKLLFSDLSVDPTTGQVTLRAEVPNPKGDLLPGLYVRVRLEQAQVNNAITLPQQAVMRSNQGDSVMVVDAQSKAVSRKVTVGSVRKGEWVILSGLKAGEQVMVDGFQKLRGDAPVKAVPWSGAAAPAGAPALAASAAAPQTAPTSAAQK